MSENKKLAGIGLAIPAGPDGGRAGAPLIILGIILLVICFIAAIPILWTIGIVVLVIGAILALPGFAGHEDSAAWRGPSAWAR